MLRFEEWPIEKFKEYDKNPRKNDDQVDRMAAAIKEFGFRIPIVALSSGLVVDGHLRLKGARAAGLTHLPVVLADELSEAQIKAFRLLANKSANWASWDDDLLRIELQDLADMGFNMDLTGFTGLEIGKISGLGSSENGEDDVPEAPPTQVTVIGDVWQCGPHRVACGDSTSITDVEKLLNGDKVDMIYTDPPYGISIVSRSSSKVDGTAPTHFKGTVGASKIVEAKKYSPVAGDDSIDVAVEAIHLIKTLAAKVEIIWGGNYYATHLDNSSCWVVWDKENTGNFADAELAWTNQKTAVRIFKHLWNGMSRAGDRKTEGKTRVHPTQKPVALAEWCINEYGEDCNIVLDLFGGSGSTILACEKLHRKCYMMEISPAYCDVIVKRWMSFTGKSPVHAETGKTFLEMQEERNAR